MSFTEGQPTPARFRRWAAIEAIAGALERRVWTITAGKPTYPNLYVLLVGPPTSGKTVAIDIVYDLWREAKAYHIAPKTITTAGLVDALKEADKKLLEKGVLLEYHSLLIPAPEFGTFISAHDLAMLANLNDIWDCPRVYGQKRRHVNGGKTIEIIFPQLNILAGAQPGFLASVMPEEAWSMGFTSRLIMVYAQESPLVSLFNGKTLDKHQQSVLIRQMISMSKLHGQFQWTEDAAHEIERWYVARLEPIPTHSKLQNYNGRRILQYLKLCMVSSVARTIADPNPELVIRREDLDRAREWLLEAESVMPDVFRGMTLKSDIEVIKELHFAMWQRYVPKKQPVHNEFIWAFLSERAPGEKIAKIIETAEKSGMIKEFAPGAGCYIPKPLMEFGPE